MSTFRKSARRLPLHHALAAAALAALQAGAWAQQATGGQL
jgi:hypothetical protein